MMAGLLCPAMSVAQVAPRRASSSIPWLVTLTAAELRGTVVDERSQPLAGVVISALGGTSAFAVSDRSGHFVLRDLPSGPYLVRAHLQGYAPPRARIVQVTISSRDISIALTKATGSNDGSFMEDSLSALAKAVGNPVRFASDFISDLPLNGQINLLTSTSFDRPQNLFSLQNGLPNSVAFVTLT